MSDAASTTDDGNGKGGGGGGMFISFLPWIVVWVLASNHSFKPALVLATLTSVGLVAWSTFEKRFVPSKGPKMLDWATLVVLAAITVVGFAADPTWLGYWLPALLNGALLAIMVVTAVAGHPFTLDYAKAEAPPEVWDTPGFRHVNQVITWVWIAAMAFMTAGACVTAVLTSGDVTMDPSQAKNIETWATWGTTVVGLVGAMKFTSWYPDAYRNRPGASGAAATA